MAEFDIIDYAANALTGFTFERKTVEYIVMKRGAGDITNLADLDERTQDLITADLLRIIYTSPSQTPSTTVGHGDFTETQGSQYISDKKNIYNWMMALYTKWGENPFSSSTSLEGGCRWLD